MLRWVWIEAGRSVALFVPVFAVAFFFSALAGACAAWATRREEIKHWIKTARAMAHAGRTSLRVRFSVFILYRTITCAAFSNSNISANYYIMRPRIEK